MVSTEVLVILVIVLGCTSPTQGRAASSLDEADADFWNTMAQNDLKDALKMKPNLNVAKNVILFLGDGMGVSTVTAGRILKGQVNGERGEEESLTFDTFPYSALIKTYNVNQQTPDSAGTATAFLGGVKTNAGVVGFTSRVTRGNCSLSTEENKVDSILDWSLREGKSVGLVTTARITHATPAAAYAHSAERNWESDVHLSNVTEGCKDIADQLITDNRDIQVLFGGGRRAFVPLGSVAPEDTKNNRKDGRNLIAEWTEDKISRGKSHVVVNNTQHLKEVDPNAVDYVLGLFSNSHMDYEVSRDKSPTGQPSLAEMTELAIKVLQKNEKGFFLLVEGGRIDHGHHASRAAAALHEVLTFDAAIETALGLTNPEDTLIVSTADHSHVFVIGGYQERGNNILGLVNENLSETTDGKPMTTLLYGNGPGYSVPRPDLTGVDTTDKDYKQQSAVGKSSETHGGEDVSVHAIGPMSHLFHGVREQNFIAHVMAYASCVGQNKDHCNSGNQLSSVCVSFFPLILTILQRWF
ncbi:alkaline phosphatase, tissue-nonspecific isozyme-like [Liolophura sinensis]|uniref:alkaline phosphatase, tissue-nonspecific isozyme-like n=1 Tax=Liolophura sinensis TaxID=3198878 RepID=UPI003158A7E2